MVKLIKSSSNRNKGPFETSVWCNVKKFLQTAFVYLILWLVFQDFECFILRFRRRWNSAVGGEPPQWQVFSKFIILSHKIKKGKKTPHQQYRNIISTISSSNLKKHSVFTSFHQNNDFPLELIVLDILIQGNTFSKYHITIHCIVLHCIVHWYLSYITIIVAIVVNTVIIEQWSSWLWLCQVSPRIERAYIRVHGSVQLHSKSVTQLQIQIMTGLTQQLVGGEDAVKAFMRLWFSPRPTCFSSLILIGTVHWFWP